MPMKKFKKRKFTKGRSTAAIARNALSLAKKAYKQSKGEIKYNVTTADFTAFSSSGTVIPLLNIAQGTSNVQRVGNQIVVKNIRMRFVFTPNQTSTLNYQFIRILLVAYGSAQGSAPTVSSILAISGADIEAITSDYPTGTYYDNKEFRVLYDKVVTSPFGTGPTNAGSIFFKKNIYRNIRVGYTGNASTNYGKNSLFLVVVASVAANDPELSYYALVGFTDE